MARLNDPLVPAESIESLKRRFIRQNREIARVNSTQSLRIRNLESEISRLLAENILLREQVINSKEELDRWRSSPLIVQGVGELRKRMETKMQELGALMEEFGGLPQRAEKNRRRRSNVESQEKVPKARRRSAALAETTAAQQENKLPVIVEDKYYPRRTLDAEELRQILPDVGEVSESPDIGPPPVAHFEDTDPIKFDANSELAESRRDIQGEDDAQLPPNLERRKKRRESSGSKGLSSLSSASEVSSEGMILGKPSFKSGAKRKFNARDDDESVIAPRQLEDFTYSKANTALDETAVKYNGNQGVTEKSRPESTEKSTQSTSKDAASSRRPLEPKCTNSPTKSNKNLTVSDKIAALREDVAKQARAREQRREKTRAANATRQPKDAPVKDVTAASEPDVEMNEPAPKTPAGLDLFSPTSTEPPASRDGQSIPEMLPTTSVEDVLGQNGRPSRRPRGAVSYAEPNLRDKMRRPTKALVAAVAESAFQKGSSMKAEGCMSESEELGMNDAEKPNMRIVTIKREDTSDNASWKNLPQPTPGHSEDIPSPLGNKSASQHSDLPLSVLTDRRRRTSVLTDSEDTTTKSRNASATISALVAGSRKTKSKETDATSVDAGLGKALDKLSIFDGPISSPRSDDSVANKSSEEDQSSSTNRHSRRHSTNPAGLKHSSSDGVTRSSDFRKQELHRSLSQRSVSGTHDRGIAESKSTRSIAPIAKVGDEGISRVDRAASRRRSTLL